MIDKRLCPIGVQLLRDAVARQPLLFGLGMGGYDEAVARLLKGAGWSMFSIPFFFRIVHPSAFLRNVTYLRRRGATVRCALDALALTGLGWLGIHGLQAFARRRPPLDPAIAAEPVAEFSDWADELWENCKDEYGMSAVRDAETLRILYPKNDPRFIRLKVTEQSRPIGWAVLLRTRRSPSHKQFGNMRLGSIVDCLAATTETLKVVDAAGRFLESQGVDLIVSNQSHAAWAAASGRPAFCKAPPTSSFASSRDLAELLDQQGVRHEDLHFNRGDGDGPINL